MQKVKNIFRTALVCVAIAAICLGGYVMFQNLCNALFVRWGWSQEPASVDLFAKGFWWAFLIYALLPPVLEELIFRLGACKLLQLTKLPDWLVIVLSAVAFMLYHQSWSQVVYQLLMGVFFAWIFLKTENVLWTMLIHFINNAFIVTYTYFVADSGTFALTTGNILGAVGLALVSTVAVIFLILKGIPDVQRA